MKKPFDFAVLDYPLAPMTYYRVGGPARVALLPRDISELGQAYPWFIAHPPPRLVLGRGSNVLISDAGYRGVVLVLTGVNGESMLGDDRFHFGAGVALERVVEEVIVPNNYEGAGALTGIPGSVGGAIFMNAGTANGAIVDFLESVDVMTPGGPGTGGPKRLEVNPSMFSYRNQTFCGPDDIIVGGTFRFRHSTVDQRAIYDHYLARRKEKQPAGFCCGSVFKNPPAEHAGRLIEACGLKGTRRGGAIISPMHANFIMNDDNATFDDIIGLIDLCKARVREQFGIELHEEVRIIR